MLAKIKKWIDKNDLIVKNDIVLAACSGGPDSLVLVDLLDWLRQDGSFALAVAHVDHMFRGEESAADAAFVGRFCQERGIPYYQTAINVPQFMDDSGRSAQDAARFLRYKYLREVAAQLGGAKIATGHHRDDQAETVLLNLLRGSGSQGFRGMAAADNGIIRPLLAVSRQEIEEYCRERGLSPRLDRSNLKSDYLRNRVRLELLPLIEKRFNPAIKEVLCRTAGIISDEHDFIRQAACQAWPDIASETAAGLELDRMAINKLHPALQRELYRLAAEKKLGALTGITFYHVEKMIELANSWSVGSMLQLPGKLVVQKGYRTVKIRFRQTPENFATAVERVELKVPGATMIPQLGVAVKAELRNDLPAILSTDKAVFDYEMIQQPVTVRTRLPGDRFWPKGMTGSKKLKEYLIDLKIPREERDRIPIICDAGKIIWVGGYRQSEHAKVTDRTKIFLQLTICNQGRQSHD